MNRLVVIVTLIVLATHCFGQDKFIINEVVKFFPYPNQKKEVKVNRNNIYEDSLYTHDKSDNLLVYPNPVSSGVSFTVEGVNKDERIYVYNSMGACVGSAIATDTAVQLTLNLHPGIYLIRSDTKGAKIVVMK